MSKICRWRLGEFVCLLLSLEPPAEQQAVPLEAWWIA
jgi:hypothetical protein